MQRVPASRYLAFVLLAACGLALDLATKSWIFARLGMPGLDPGIPLVGRYLALQTSLNEGALFGMGQGFSALFAGLSIVAGLAIVYWLFWAGNARDWLPTIALGSISGGVMGNLFDRLGLPGLVWHYPPARVGEPVRAVRDWIHFQVPGVFDFPVFNIADSLLVCGAGLLIIYALKGEPKDAPVSSPGHTPSAALR